MKEVKTLKSFLKRRKKVVESLVVVFMITGSIQSFATDMIGTSGDDIIDVTSDLAGGIYGNDPSGTTYTVDSDEITVKENVKITTGFSTGSGMEEPNIYGDYISNDMETGGEDIITLEKGSSVEGLIYGTYSEKDLKEGGKDVIKLEEGSSVDTIYGDFSAGSIITGGVDQITVDGGNVYMIAGDRASVDIEEGGVDKIKVENEGTASYIFGENALNVELGGADEISIDSSTITDDIYGDYATDTIGKGGADKIALTNGSSANLIYGEYANALLKTGEVDEIKLSGKSSAFMILGDSSSGDIGEGGADIITVDDSNVSFIYGEHAEGSIGKGGEDKITVTNGGSVESPLGGDIYGELAEGSIGEGGADEITIENSKVAGRIYGELAEGSIGEGGADEITIDNSEIGMDIYGEYSYSTIKKGGDDTITLIGASTIDGKVSGGEDSSGIVTGDYDTLNLSAYTTDFTSLNYEGIEEVNLVDDTAIDLGDGAYTSNSSEIFNIEAGSSIKADNGSYIMDTSLTNNGTIDLVGDSGHIMGDELTINGDFSGNGGVINLDMNAMDLTSDMIVVKGNFTGTQLINPTMIDTEIEFKERTVDFMEVEGVNSGEIGFASVSRSSGLITKGRISGSAFEWEVKGSSMDTGSDMWSITTAVETVTLPELPAYASLQNIGEDMIHSNVDSLYTRLGDIRRYKAENEGESLTKDKVVQDDDYMELSRDGVTVWTRATAEYFDYEANDDAYGYDGDVSGFDIGADYTFELSRDTAVVTGLLYGKRYGNFETSTSDEGKYVVAESADIDMDSWSLAAYGTFIYKDNTYLDLVAGYTDYESDIDAPGLNDSVDGDAIWGSAEVGHSFQVGDIWRVEPQLQLTYTEVDFDDTTNDIGTEVEYSSNNQLTGRIGTIVSAGIPINEVAQVRPWFGVSVLQEFMDPEDVTYGGSDFEGQDIDTYIEYKLGVQVDLNKALGMYVEGKYQTDYDDYDSYRGTLGVKYSF